ncbi:MAG: galactokinase [Spirochaetaceae bacterium]|jgi:galactokinase|nr:galactokinase [Spirochaetaceae bacterium]
MNGKTLTEKITDTKSTQTFENLYGSDDVKAQQARYTQLVNGLINAFPETEHDVRLFTAAGRTELGGNHTDHNHGKVLAASIQLDAVAAVSPRNDKKIIFRSSGFPDVNIDISNLTAQESERGTTESLVRGIASEMAGDGIAINGWTAHADSTVLPGSGLSSSAACEVLCGSIFNHLYAKGKYTPLQIAQMAQRAENNYFGKPCGLMDQAASAIGGAVMIDFADNENPKVESIAFNPEAFAYALCVVDTKGSHADLTSDYASIPQEMKTVAAYFGKEFLRELEDADLLANISALRKAVGDRAVLRALHFFNENDRVGKMADAIKISSPASMQTYLSLVAESGASSFELLQNCYALKNPCEQGIPLALALTKKFSTETVCRVHGGGFAGTIQVYLPLEAITAYKKYIEKVFGSGAVTILKIRSIGTKELLP